jgi:hypothetical protein
MATSLTLWLLSLLVLSTITVAGVLDQRRKIHITARQIHRCAVHQRELLQVVENHRLLQEVQNVTESLVDEGTSLIRNIHKEIASIPFEILEAHPKTRDTSKVVRGVHDVTSDSIYAGISLANQLFGRKLRKRMRISENEALTDSSSQDFQNDKQ